MFSGIVEAVAPIISVEDQHSEVIRIRVQRPPMFEDIGLGDSVCCSGVCLTVEAFNSDWMQFALGPETLKVTGWKPSELNQQKFNLERSLRLQDRIHGHMVSGHVDTMSTVLKIEKGLDHLRLWLALDAKFRRLIWTKGSVAINGVSLTVNTVGETDFSVWLIPETLKRTNLGELSVGSSVNLEWDSMAKAIVNCIENHPTKGFHL